MTRLIERYYRPPFIGIVAFIAVFSANPILHGLVVAMREIAGPTHAFIVYQSVALLAVAALFYGIKKNTEISGTLLGFVSGMLLWTCWASYAFKFNQYSLHLPKIPIAADGYSRSASLFYIQGSIGICCATLLFFVFNKDTKCNAFRWIQRVFRFNLGAPGSAQGRNVCRITFLETIYVVWFCYCVSLFVGDERFLGYHHPVSYAITIGIALWSPYLLWRLFKFTRVMAAIRYAIPVKSIVWFIVGEMAPKYGFYNEFWLNPLQYSAAMYAIVGVCISLLLASAFLPQRRQARTD
jgi:hypothetical protein